MKIKTILLGTLLLCILGACKNKTNFPNSAAGTSDSSNQIPGTFSEPVLIEHPDTDVVIVEMP